MLGCITHHIAIAARNQKTPSHSDNHLFLRPLREIYASGPLGALCYLGKKSSPSISIRDEPHATVQDNCSARIRKQFSTSQESHPSRVRSMGRVSLWGHFKARGVFGGFQGV